MNAIKIVTLSIILNLLLATAFTGMNTGWETDFINEKIDIILAPYLSSSEGSVTDSINGMKIQSTGATTAEASPLEQLLSPVTNAISGIANTFEGMIRIGLFVVLAIPLF